MKKYCCWTDQKDHVHRNYGFTYRAYQCLDNVEVKSLESEYDSADVNILPIHVVQFVTHPEYIKSILDLLKSDLVQNNPDMIIVFWIPTEAHVKSWDYKFIREQERFLKEIPNHRKYLIIGDVDARNNYAKYLKTHLPKHRFTEVFYLNFFESSLNNIPITLDHYIADKKSDFLCMMKKYRPHRLALMAKLNHNKLASGNSYVSFMMQDQDLKDEFFIKQANEFLLDKEIVDASYIVNNQISRKLDIDIGTPGIPKPPGHLYNSSYFSLISETLVDTLFLTEKTYTAILIGHPFIIWGGVGTLRYLRSLGYKTYPKMFDESYDDEPDDRKRLSMIITEVKKFCRLSKKEKECLYDKQKDVIIHNQINIIRRQRVFAKEFRHLIKVMEYLTNDTA